MRYESSFLAQMPNTLDNYERSDMLGEWNERSNVWKYDFSSLKLKSVENINRLLKKIDRPTRAPAHNCFLLNALKTEHFLGGYFEQFWISGNAFQAAL